MIPSIATGSNLIVSKKHEAKGQGIALEFIKLGIHVQTKLVTSISWLPLDRIDLKLELKQILYINLYHLKIILFA